jgi:putative nucleotidyltransferase with HDIG domain
VGNIAETEFTPIRVSTLRGDLKIPFDVYVHVAGKYIHYCRAGESFEGKRLERLKTKKLKKMYIRPDDTVAYKGYLEASIDAAYDTKSGKPLDVRAEVIQGFQQAESEVYMEDPLNHMQYNHLRSSMQRFVEFLQREPAGAGAILKLENIDLSITHHSVNVATITTAMALDLKLKENPQMELLALGCMVHDIDHFYNGADVTKPFNTLTDAEKEVYRNHPMNGANRLTGAKFLDQMVLNIVLQHEEFSNGTGYPKGTLEKDMDPLVMVAACANAYDRLVSFEKISPKDAMKKMFIDKVGLYPLNYMQSLQKNLKVLGLI